VKSSCHTGVRWTGTSGLARDVALGDPSPPAVARRVVAALGLDAGAIQADPTPPSVERPRPIDLEDDRAREHIGWSPWQVLCPVGSL
jgi:hypothetical protein